MNERTIRIGDVVRHFKREFVSPESSEYLYRVIAFAQHTETGENLVIYQAMYPPFKTCARPYDMFMSRVDREKYPDASQEYRFEVVRSTEDIMPALGVTHHGAEPDDATDNTYSEMMPDVWVPGMKNYPGVLRVPEAADFSKVNPQLEPIRLHLELVKYEYCTYPNDELIEKQRIEYAMEARDVLRTYGEVKYGNTISRDIIVPGDIPLWALNYAIQRCFGWQNSHLHQFVLPEEQFSKLTNKDSRRYVDLVGVVFRSPWMNDDEEFWNDDYVDGYFKSWMRRKYTGPYESLCYGEGIWRCKQDMKELEEHFAYVEVEHGYMDNGYEYYNFPKPIDEKEYRKRKARGPVEIHVEEGYRSHDKVFSEVYEFDEIPFDAIKWISERPINRLLERLSVSEVLVLHNKGIYDKLVEWTHVPECFEDFMNEELLEDIERFHKLDDLRMQPYI